ncbi:MAG: ABC transporter ATP-binding protein [Microbacteriaceae bacterium]|nr:ABC transporter ATP-binding protein [Microbacteriaceae bacterium]
MSESLLEVNHLDVVYGRGRSAKQALHDVSIAISAGETLGLVGESGSGKTTLGRTVLGLVPASRGSIVFDGTDITRLDRRGRRRLATELQAVFQDPYSSLNPSMTVSDILVEPLIAQGVKRLDADERIRQLMASVSLPPDSLTRYAREFSGGQRQRIAIARALALDPRLIVCDEPVSALDLTTQLRVLDLLIEIQERTGVAYLFITHDLAVVRYMSHRVAVMHQGRIVETGDTGVVTERPEQEYTKRLLVANLVADPEEQARRRQLRWALG